MEPTVLQVLSTLGAQAGAPASADYARWVRDALRHLYDPVYLQTHPLTGVLTEQELSATPSAKGQRLRQVLLDAIAALQPASPREPLTTGRRYMLLTLRYVEALDRDDVCARLAISRREYDREHQQALAAVVSLLWDTATPSPAPVSSPSHRPPAPVTGHAPATRHLPRPLTSFIGRAQEIREVRQLLTAARLVTLTGPPGTGKTRLALHVAEELAAASGRDATTGVDGITFVPLASIRDPALVVPALAQALDVRDTPPHSLLASVEDQVRDRHALLILDNFEQVLDAAPVVAHLLAACPHLTVLVTSRASLRLSGEHAVVVPPLQAPAHEGPIPLEQLGRYDAVRLYVERARAVQARFRLTDQNAAAVRELCRRLDGLPLAIELAAARNRIFPPYALLGRLTGREPGDHPGSTGDAPGSSLPLLIGGARDLPARQQTLHSAIDWSYRLLTADEQRLFARLSTFAGGWTLAAAEAVCAAPGTLDVLEGLASLVDKSLVRPEEFPDGEPRFSMLETIGEYARAQLAAREEGRTVQRQHAEYVLALAQEAEAHVWGRAQALWLRRLNGELANLRAALAWSRDNGEVELALQLGGALFWFWHDGGHWTEARTWLESALAVATPAHRTVGRAATLAALGLCRWCLGDVATARSQSEECLAIYREVGDRRGMGHALHGLGVLAADQGEVARAHVLLEEGLSLARAVGDRPFIGLGLHQLGLLAIHAHDEDSARARIEESQRVWQELGSTASLSLAASCLGDLARARGAFAEAAAHYQEGLELLGAAGPPGWRITYLHNLGHVLHRQGDDRQARALFAEALVLCRALGDRRGVAESVAGLACLLAETQPEHTARLLGAAAAVIEAMGAQVSRPNQAEYDQGLAFARSRVGDAACDAAWRHGRTITLEQAVTAALTDGPQAPDTTR